MKSVGQPRDQPKLWGVVPGPLRNATENRISGRPVHVDCIVTRWWNCLFYRAL